MTTWKLVASAALLAGAASAAEPANVQDPPGKVDVDQPAGVSFPDRNTDRDTTDTLRGAGRTDVIDGERAPRRAAAPDIRAAESSSNVQPGTEARASFEGGTGSATAPSAGSATGAGAAASEGAGSSTSLGTDLGYGTGTEPGPSGAAR